MGEGLQEFYCIDFSDNRGEYPDREEAVFTILLDCL
jgi:hypothetical protein